MAPSITRIETIEYSYPVRDVGERVGDEMALMLDGSRKYETWGRAIEIGVFNLGDEFAAVANYCVHQGGPIAEGKLAGGTLTADEDFQLVYDESVQCIHCPWHGWEFDVESGEHTAPSGYRLPTYGVVARDGELYVKLG